MALTNKGLLDRVLPKHPENRRLIIRRRARELRHMCASTNMAYKPGDEFIDSITDAEWEQFKLECQNQGLVQRPDFRWEMKAR